MQSIHKKTIKLNVIGIIHKQEKSLLRSIILAAKLNYQTRFNSFNHIQAKRKRGKLSQLFKFKIFQLKIHRRKIRVTNIVQKVETDLNHLAIRKETSGSNVMNLKAKLEKGPINSLMI